MKNLDKKMFLQEVIQNEAYQAAISRVTPAEKKMVEEFLHGKFFDVMAALQGFAEKVQTDPALRASFVQALNQKVGIIKSGQQESPQDETTE